MPVGNKEAIRIYSIFTMNAGDKRRRSKTLDAVVASARSRLDKMKRCEEDKKVTQATSTSNPKPSSASDHKAHRSPRRTTIISHRDGDRASVERATSDKKGSKPGELSNTTGLKAATSIKSEAIVKGMKDMKDRMGPGVRIAPTQISEEKAKRPRSSKGNPSSLKAEGLHDDSVDLTVLSNRTIDMGSSSDNEMEQGDMGTTHDQDGKMGDADKDEDWGGDDADAIEENEPSLPADLPTMGLPSFTPALVRQQGFYDMSTSLRPFTGLAGLPGFNGSGGDRAQLALG
ncbi:hypothetical protein AAMO2058_000963800 [Amorphochlora amoebiformis]